MKWRALYSYTTTQLAIEMALSPLRSRFRIRSAQISGEHRRYTTSSKKTIFEDARKRTAANGKKSRTNKIKFTGGRTHAPVVEIVKNFQVLIR